MKVVAHPAVSYEQVGRVAGDSREWERKLDEEACGQAAKRRPQAMTLLIMALEGKK